MKSILQPKAGRLDLLLEDTETKKWYEVKLQLGRCDESHIIRAVEYWDFERKRYPQYEHCAVIVAEELDAQRRLPNWAPGGNPGRGMKRNLLICGMVLCGFGPGRSCRNRSMPNG
jgi:hypothetical protein